MMQSLAEKSPGVAEVFERGEKALKPLIKGSLKDIVWGDREDPAIAGRLRQTEICQPAMLTADIAMMRWLNDAGLTPDWVAGHSLGEYAACVAAGVMDFEDALHAVSARGKEMAAVDVPDCGKMATVAAGERGRRTPAKDRWLCCCRESKLSRPNCDCWGNRCSRARGCAFSGERNRFS